MKVKLLLNDKEIEVEISDEEFKKLSLQNENKKTGYEINNRKSKWTVNAKGRPSELILACSDEDSECYQVANYYTSYDVANNNARADTLMRQLRRFAVEHRKEEIDWTNDNQSKYIISYSHGNNSSISINIAFWRQDFNIIYFDSEETAQLAIDTFYDELIWYFTEYKDSL